jgi:hypothetical protein
MEQTAIQNLIMELEQFAKFPMVEKATIEAAIAFAKLRLRIEKEQMIDTFTEGYNAGWCMAKEHADEDQIYDAEEYYAKTYESL